MCRSKEHGGRRCLVDDSTSRNHRRIASTIRDGIEPHERPLETTMSLDTFTAPHVELEDLKLLARALQGQVSFDMDAVKMEVKISELGAMVAALSEKRAGINIDEVEAKIKEIDSKQEDIVKRIHSIIGEINIVNRKNKKEIEEISDEIKELSDLILSEQEHYSERLEEIQPKISKLQKKRDALYSEESTLAKQRAELQNNAAELEKEKENLTSKTLNKLSESYHGILAELRPLGGTVINLSDEGCNKDSVKLLQSAVVNYPSAWIDKSNEQDDHIRVGKTSVRAHYASRSVRRSHKFGKQVIVSYQPAGWLPPENNDRYTGWVSASEVSDESMPNYIKHCIDNTMPNEVAWVTPVWEEYSPYLHRRDRNGDPSGPGWVRHQLSKDVYNSDEGKYEVEARSVWRRQKKIATSTTNSVSAEILVDRDPSPVGEPGFGTATHEFAHRVEHARPHLTRLEEAFLVRRTTLEEGNREKLVRYFNHSGEYVRPDNFADQYMGKQYKHGSREVLSCGIAAVFAGEHGGLVGLGKYKKDIDSRNFILGTLAAG